MRLTRLAETGAIIPAAGQGKRMGGQGNKLFLELAGTPVLILTLQTFERCSLIREVVIPAAAADIPIIEDMVSKYNLRKVSKVVLGGKERQESVFKALQALNKDIARVVVHDGARPLLTLSDLHTFLEKAQDFEAAIMAVPVKDTVKKVDKEGVVVETPVREHLRAVQTPQVFERELLQEMHQIAIEQGRAVTDDASLFEGKGYKVKVFDGSYDNLKVTTPEDLIFAEVILQKRRGGKPCE